MTAANTSPFILPAAQLRQQIETRHAPNSRPNAKTRAEVQFLSPASKRGEPAVRE